MDELQELKLKYQGLLQRVGTQASKYEDEIAELRTKATLIANAYEALQERYKELAEGQNEPVQEATAIEATPTDED